MAAYGAVLALIIVGLLGYTTARQITADLKFTDEKVCGCSMKFTSKLREKLVPISHRSGPGLHRFT